MKRVIAVILAVMLMCMLCVPVLADEPTGSITIHNAVEKQTYSVYQLAVLESYNAGTGAYSYKPVSAWQDFFTGKSDLFTIDNGYVTLKAGVTLSDAQKVELAKDALQYAKTNSIAPNSSAQPTKGEDGTFSVQFNSLPLGYYLVDSTLGALCGLTTTAPSAEINEKNGAPTIDKQVQEDSNDLWQETNDADFYQTIQFKTIVTAQAGAQNYVLHDKMTGMDLNASSVQVYLNGEEDANLVAAGQYTLVTDTTLTDGCAFEIRFTDAFCNTLAANDKIYVTYTAALNENAVIAGSGNPNETWLNYGESTETTNETTHEKTYTYVYEFDLIKTDASNQLLDGAEFKLYDAAENGNEIKVVKEADGSYRVAKASETGTAIVVTGGSATITGLDGNTTYYLEETVAPSGYNKLSGRKAFTIGTTNLKASFDSNEVYTPGTGVQIVNKTGSLLPGTGGFGTMMFTLIGAILVIGTGILLVVNKRMSKISD